MKFRIALCCLILGLTASAQTTPNLGLTVPPIGSFNWGTSLNGNFDILDLMAGGGVPVPALNVDTLELGTAKATVNDPTTGFILSSKLQGTIPAAIIPTPTASTLGGVESKTCPGSAINAILTDGTESCAASSTGGNGGITNSAPTTVQTANGSYQTVYSYTVPANLLSSTGGLDVYCGYVLLNALDTGRFRFNFGSQSMPVSGPLIPTQQGYSNFHIHLFNNGATNSQWYTIEWNVVGYLNGVTYGNQSSGVLSVDTTSNQTFACQLSYTNGDQYYGTGFYVNRAQQ